jgi:transmembrane sensor
MNEAPLSLPELLRDDEFIRWTRQPTPELDQKWENYLVQFPKQAATLEQAKSYIHLIAEDTGRDLPTLRQSKKMWQEVQHTIQSENSKN